MASKFSNLRVPVFKRMRQRWNKTLHLSQSKQNLRTIVTDSNIVSSTEKMDRSVDGVTIPELLRSNLHRWENDNAFDCAVTGRTYKHGEIFKKGRSFAAALMQLGLKRNDVIGVILPNIPEFPIVYLGMWDAGLIPSPTNLAYCPVEIAQQMLACEAKAIVTVSEMAEAANQVRKSCPKLKSVIVIGEAQQDCHSFYEMTKVDTTGVNFLKGSDITDEDVAVIPYSSGTTGPPKGVMLTHKSIATNIVQLSHTDFHDLHFNEGGSSQDRLIGVLPFFHIYGLTVLLGLTLYQGHYLSCLSKFQPHVFVNLLRKHKPTYMHLVPPLFGLMVGSPEISKKDTTDLRTMGNGAAPLPIAVLEKVLEKFGNNVFLQQGYGMTELSPASHITWKRTKNSKPSSMGNTLPETQCKVVCVETGKALGRDQRGELCIKGPQVMKGYFNNEKATKETIDSEGWLHTGDIAYYDKDESFYIVDRIKELIKVNGFQVAPFELEDILLQHPAVADAAVIGIPDSRAGELPRAYIVKNPKHAVSEAELQEYAAKRLAKYKYLKGGVEFVDKIPKSPSGKVLRKELKEDFLKRHQK